MKRHSQVTRNVEPRKKIKLSKVPATEESLTRHAVLSRYYSQVFTLREYLLWKLPASSKGRRKKISSVHRMKGATEQADGLVEGREVLGSFLGQTLVGVLSHEATSRDERLREWASYSQRADTSGNTNASSAVDGKCSQSEVVDFVIWLLLSKTSRSGFKAQHLLCDGFRKTVGCSIVDQNGNATSTIPGVVSEHPNSHVAVMKAHPWPEILSLLGRDGERVMIDLLLDCGVFTAIPNGQGNFHQLSGKALGSLETLQKDGPVVKVRASKGIQSPPNMVSAADRSRSAADIVFVRNRMFYARAALNAHGEVSFGLRHIHVLNRCPLKTDLLTNYHGADVRKEKPNMNHDPSTLHILMYIFPRLFGLHNVFTSTVDKWETVQPFKDYTLREEEIGSKYGKPDLNPDTVKVPKRLRGSAIELIKKMQDLHARCSYLRLLNYYCPEKDQCATSNLHAGTDHSLSELSATYRTQASTNTTAETLVSMVGAEKIKSRKQSMLDYATPTSQVSAFCRATLGGLIPNGFWGNIEVQNHNKKVFMANVDRFIKLRRFESLSLHEVMQGMKVNGISWLALGNSDAKTSESDTRKRLEIFHEFLYYAFDSILIPLVRTNFHVTESNIHRSRLFFFRHDTWRALAEPNLASMKVTMFEEVKMDIAQRILDSRTIGYSQIRLLPKEKGARPIMNLRRRVLQRGGKNMLGRSINSVLAPVHNVFTLEKNANPEDFGSALFSVSDIYTKLRQFNGRLRDRSKPLYFVKLDVQSAFDTIPQGSVTQLMAKLPRHSAYRVCKHVEIKPRDGHRLGGQSNPLQKWVSLATPSTETHAFDNNLQKSLVNGKNNTILVDNVIGQSYNRSDLLDLLTEHIERNIVKIGKKFYRQKQGIPQGSVLSSLICNYFYADLEERHLSFLKDSNYLLLRLIDDFLLITTDQVRAKKFLQIMHDGLPDYGLVVNPDKTLVNFEISIKGKKINRLVGSTKFPYCRNFIDTLTLNVTKDREKRKDITTADFLTVEMSKTPGKTFQRKTLDTFKIQAQAMFLDTSFNSTRTVMRHIYESFLECAMKMWTYAKCLPQRKQPRAFIVIKTISSLIELAFVLIKSKGKSRKNEGYCCAVTRVQVEWLALSAFKRVLERRQAKYIDVLAWLGSRIEVITVRKAKECGRVAKLLGDVSQIEC